MERVASPETCSKAWLLYASGMAEVLTRNPRAFIACCLALSALGRSARAEDPAPNKPRAQEAAAYQARAEVNAPIAATSSEDATAAGTTIEVGERPRALESVADVIADSPGARIQSTGGFGAFAGVALRGAGIAHTTVLLGDVPLSTPDTEAFDLSLIPPAVIDSIEIYRGGAPIWWSDGAIGGIVRLVPRSAKQSYLQMQSGYGSFGRFELATTTSLVRESGVRESGARPAFLSHVGFARADNDYSYVEDGQTLFDSTNAPANADDVEAQQRNADIDSGNGLAHAGADLLGGRLDLVLTGHGRVEGVPGPLAAPTDQVRRKLVRMLGAVSWTKEAFDAASERRYRVQALASASHQNNRVADPEAEVGISRLTVSDDDWNHVYARVAGSLALLRALEPTLVASVSHDDYVPRNALALSGTEASSSRATQALALETRMHGDIDGTQLELRPSARGQWTQASTWIDTGTTLTSEREHRDDAFLTARIAGVVAPMPALAFSASAATGARAPSIRELFGDRVTQVANPELLPERSRSFDASVVTRGRSGELRGSAELRGFVLFIDDLISYRRTAQFAYRAENVHSARVLGGELGVQGSYGRHFWLTSAVTVMHSRNQFGKTLPLRPPLQLNVRPELALFPGFAHRLTLYVEGEHTGFMYLDAADRTFVADRTIFSVGATLSLLRDRIVLSARAQNVLDDQATDMLSRPLPGTQLFVSLAAQEWL